jgi:hypothetical protein
MSRKKEGRAPQKAAKHLGRGSNGYLHVAKPATASEILRDLGISKTEMKRLLRSLKFSGAQS